MIWHAIDKMRAAGVRRVMIVTGTEHAGGLFQSLRAGAEFDCEFTYRVQDQAGGIAEALGLVRGFAAGGPVTVILGDNLFEDSIAHVVRPFRSGARVLLKKVPDP